MASNLTVEHLGKYDLRIEIMQRRQSVIVEARDPVHDCPVLLNVWTKVTLDDESLARFEQHTKKVMGLQHPNILSVLDYGVVPEQNLAYWVLPYIGITSLEQNLGSPWPVAEAVRVVAEVAHALDHASQSGIMHGCISPESILLTERGWSLLTDFGMREFFEGDWEAAHQVYWSPERLQGGPTQLASDLYTLGIILYEMLAGQSPFVAGNLESLVAQQAQSPRPIRKIRADVPREIDTILVKLLAVDPQQRFNNGAALARALVDALPPDGTKSSRPITPPPNASLAQKRSDGVPLRQASMDRGSFWKRFGNGLWHVARWLLGKIAAALVILVLICAALAVGATFLVSSMLEQRLATYQWRLEGWERGGKSYILEKYINTPLQQVVEPYTLGALTDLGVEFYAPDVVELHGRFQAHPLSFTIGLYADGGIPQVQLRRFNDVTLYIVGGIISDGINRGMNTSWQEVPVRLSVFRVEDDGIDVVLVPVDSQGEVH